MTIVTVLCFIGASLHDTWVLLLAASMWLRVHVKTAANVPRRRREQGFERELQATPAAIRRRRQWQKWVLFVVEIMYTKYLSQIRWAVACCFKLERVKRILVFAHSFISNEKRQLHCVLCVFSYPIICCAIYARLQFAFVRRMYMYVYTYTGRLLLWIRLRMWLCCFVSVDFSIQVLSSGSWPFNQSCTFTLPPEVSIGICA